MKDKHIWILGLLISFNSQSQQPTLFQELDPNRSGVDFVNEIFESDSLNFFLEDDLYNGAGVAVGDINNDGLVDLYFVSNFGKDQLYLNKGNLQFENITDKAFPDLPKTTWKTAVAMGDVNGDGYLDIYVCQRGTRKEYGPQRPNLLFINNGDLTFTEKGEEWKVNGFGRSNDVDFLDYDLDGDLDIWVTNRRLNTSIMEQYTKSMKQEQHHSNRLFRNDGDHFTDVTDKASGLLSFGLCLSSSIADLNGDGWPDIYVSGDYNLPDFMFINDGNGLFKNQLNMRTRHTSHYGMGVDIADFNNDGWQDVFVLDMSNTTYEKSKTNMGSMSIANFWRNVSKGYNYQYMYNTLQLNLGHAYFSEVAQMAGIASTDWSWAPLVADFDGDGWKDLFVTNGYLRDVRDQDFMAGLRTYMDTTKEFDVQLMLSKIPVSREVNFLFKNQGDLTFNDVSTDWGVTHGSVSQGAAYADLDNDGDLDLIVNNMNETASILENKSEGKRYIQLQLRGPEKNTFAVGTKVDVVLDDDRTLTQEIYPSRGYASSSDYRLTFGLGAAEIKKIIIHWNPKETTVLTMVKANQLLAVDYNTAKKESADPIVNPFAYFKTPDHQFARVGQKEVDDFQSELLIPHKMSELGPFMCAGDVNEDGTEDLYVGGNRDFPGRLFVSGGEQLKNVKVEAFELDSAFEDGDAVFFDIEGDGDLDLYVTSGGNEYQAGSEPYRDRLYINDGQGNFSRDFEALPDIKISGQCVVAHDVDGDGDMDLFVGGRQLPAAYPTKVSSYILENKNGKFTDITSTVAPQLKDIGMITDAIFEDVNGDGKADLVTIGEWMTPMAHLYEKGKYKYDPTIFPEEDLHGWWNDIVALDIDGDGSKELLLGNNGLNNKFHPSREKSLKIYLDDFDKNGRKDIVLSKYASGEEHPVRGRECLSQQMPEISEKYKTYVDFAQAEFSEIFALPDSYQYVNEMRSGYLKLKDKKWSFVPFDNFAQLGPINQFVSGDINGDGKLDFVAVGNRYEAEIETPRYDGNPGLIFINKGSGVFDIFPIEQVGISLNKNAKDAVRIGSDIYISNSGENITRYSIFME